MPYTVKTLVELDIVELALSGSVSGTELKASATECISVQRQTGATRFLVDGNSWEAVPSVTDIYELPKLYGKEGLNWATRIALILPPSLSGKRAARDYETMCQNRGFQVRVCPDRQNAIEWLKGA